MCARERIAVFGCSRAALPRPPLARARGAQARAAARLDGCFRVVPVPGRCVRAPLGYLCARLARLRLTDWGRSDCYWFPDYIADLDALLRALASEAPVHLVGHSLGGNVACMYAGVRPERIAKLVNLEGFGLAATRPED